MEKRYSISDASRQIEVENHVLRYWEEELGLCIARNAKGHRYYSDDNINTLKKVKDLKEQGFQLRAIKLIIHDLDRVMEMNPREMYKLREELNAQAALEEESHNVSPGAAQPNKTASNVTSLSDAKFQKFEKMLKRMVDNAVNEGRVESEQRIYEQVSTKVIKEMDYIFRQREEKEDRQTEMLQQIMDRLDTSLSESAASKEIPVIKSKREKGKDKPKKNKVETKEKRLKLFAK